MSVRERILAIKLMEKKKDNKMFMNDIGVSANLKVSANVQKHDTKHKSK